MIYNIMVIVISMHLQPCFQLDPVFDCNWAFFRVNAKLPPS